MDDYQERVAGLRLLAEQGWAWLIANSLSILIAVCAGAVLVGLLLGVRALGVWLGRASHRSAFGKVIGRVVAKSQFWFMVALAAEVVVDITAPPAGISNIVRFIFTVAAALQGAIWLRELILGWVEERAQASGDDSNSLASALGIIRLLVSIAAFALAAILILDNLGVNVTALVAGLGIGGIAIGLAAQGIFSDLFAALSILFDKPFSKGDAISWDTGAGTVESIGLKTTRIRALTGERIIVSNANLLGKELRNLERLDRRRVSFMLGLIYQTPPSVLEKVPDILRAVVEHHDKCVFVRSSFVTFSPSSLDFELLFDVMSDNFDEVTLRRTRVATAILRVFAEHGIAIAYPTQTTFTADPEGRMIMPYPVDAALFSRVAPSNG